MLSGKGLPPPEWDGGQGAEGSGGSSALPFVLPAAPDVSRADERIRRTFCSDGGGEWCDCIECGAWDAGRVAAACAPDVVWEDMSLEEPLRGSQAVYAHLVAAQAEDERNGATIAIERIADGERASGFTFHRAREGVSGRGLRGTLYLEVDDQGRIQYVRVGVEPLFKPGEATAKLLKAIAEKQAGDGGTADARPAGALERRTPTACSDVVRYLWCDVQGSGASVVDESVRFFSDGVRYEDFNYEQPFLGKAAVEAFLREFDIPGLTFVVERVSDGESACAFCWEVDLGMGEGARRVKGISFYELDQDGKIAYGACAQLCSRGPRGAHAHRGAEDPRPGAWVPGGTPGSPRAPLARSRADVRVCAGGGCPDSARHPRAGYQAAAHAGDIRRARKARSGPEGGHPEPV